MMKILTLMERGLEMPRLNEQQIAELEKTSEQHDGKCPTCYRPIKFYRYTLNRTLALFLRRLADNVRDTGVNDVDIGSLGMPYSIQSQMAKARQHGLIARVKNAEGVQIQRHWLITHKGWDWLAGKPQPKKVVVFNNQVLGHDGGEVTIYEALGERAPVNAPIYEEKPVTPAESRTYRNVRQPVKHMKVKAIYKGRTWEGHYHMGGEYELTIEKLQVGKPVKIIEPHPREYHDIAAFQRDWRAL